jgi:hypothetical protein
MAEKIDDWVRLEKYCEDKGETPEAVRCRRKKGVWKDGVQSKVVAGHIWVNVKEAQKWVQDYPLSAVSGQGNSSQAASSM